MSLREMAQYLLYSTRMNKERSFFHLRTYMIASIVSQLAYSSINVMNVLITFSRAAFPSRLRHYRLGMKKGRPASLLK